PQRVPERVAEAAVERLDLEDAAVLLDVLVGDARDLEIHRGTACRHWVPFFGGRALLGVELDDQLFLDRRVDLLTLRSLPPPPRQSFVVRLEQRRDCGREVSRTAHRLLGGRT